MKKSAYVLMLGFAGACTAGFVACGGSSDTVSNSGAGGQVTTGGASGVPASTGGNAQVGGTAAAIGGTAATGGSATSLQTGGAATGGAATGGSNSTGGSAVASGGTSNAGGTSTAGGATGAADLQQTCIDVCKLLETRTTPLACMPTDCAGTCDVTYTKLYNAVPACGNDYLAMLKCGVTQPANSWTCFTASSGTGSVSIPVPPSSASTDACFAQFQKLYLTIIQNFVACGGALQ